MLCPFCGKERKNHKRCPKCHKVQRQKWRGVTEPDYEHLFIPKEEAVFISSDDDSMAIQLADKSVSESSSAIVSHTAVNWVRRIKPNKHGQNE